MTTSAYIPGLPYDPRGPGSAFPIGLGAAHSVLAFMGNSEPPLAEMMADDVIRRVMARDGVAVDQLMSLIDQVRTRLR